MTEYGGVVGGYVSAWLWPSAQQATTASDVLRQVLSCKWSFTTALVLVCVGTVLQDVAGELLMCCLPLWGLVWAHYSFCLVFRKTFSASDAFVVALSGVVAEVSVACCGGVASELRELLGPTTTSTLLWALVCTCGCSLAAPRAVKCLPVIGALRLAAVVVAVQVLPVWGRAVVGHLCGMVGLLAARFTEARLWGSRVSSVVSPDGRLLVMRRRRAGSSPALQGGLPKGRRTSLPVLGQQRHYYGQGYQVKKAPIFNPRAFGIARTDRTPMLQGHFPSSGWDVIVVHL